MNPDQLRNVVRAEVLRAIESGKSATRALESGRGRVLAILTGAGPLTQVFLSQLETIRKSGYGIQAVPSRTWTESSGTWGLTPLTSAGIAVAEAGSGEGSDWGAVAAILPTISANTAAKVTSGIRDSMPSGLLADLLENGVPVVIGQQLEDLSRSLHEALAKAPPSMLRLRERHLHFLQQLGVHFTAPEHVAAKVLALLAVPVNETPERLARAKPPARREFVTADDVRKAQVGLKVLTHARDAYVTDEARDEAARLGVELRAD